jgi:hypothetical protein
MSLFKTIKADTFLNQTFAAVKSKSHKLIEYTRDTTSNLVVDSNNNHYNKNEKKLINELGTNAVVIERNGGLRNKYVLFLLCLWYFFSGTTLYTSKYMVATQRANPKIIATTQMFLTSLLGYIQMTVNRRNQMKNDLIINNSSSSSKSQALSRSTWMLCFRNMIIIGLLR